MGLEWRDVKGFAARAVTENLRLKSVALVVTLGLFVIVRFQEEVDRWIDVEVAVMRPAEKSGLVVTSDVPDKVRVSLRGRTSVIKAVKSGDAGQVVMDLSGRTAEGAFTFYFEPEMFDFPSGVEILHITPESVPIRVERIISRRVAVNVRALGRPRPGLELEGAPVAVPPEATISGPSSAVAAIAAIDTEEIDVGKLDLGRHELHVPLKRVDGVVVKYVDKLTVVVVVRYTPGQRTLQRLPVRVVAGGQRLAEGADARPEAVAATLAGPQVALDALDPAAVVAIADVDAVDPPRGAPLAVPVQLDGLPDGVEVKAIDPPTVRVRLTGAAAAKRAAAAPPR